MTAETLIIHGGDLVEWREASGYIGKSQSRITPERLQIEFSKAPKALRVYHKTHGTLLWHKNSAGPSKVITTEVAEADLIAEVANTYEIEGSVSDPSGHYLPRTFAFTLGNTSEHAIKLYQSPLASRFTQAGGIYGSVAFDNKIIAAWALITLTVTPSLGPALTFVAQADAHGEFNLPLDRLPALTKDAPATKYNAKLEVKASAAAKPETPLDPEKLTAIKVAKGKTGNGTTQFADFFTFDITPGKVAKVTSPEHTQIVLKST